MKLTDFLSFFKSLQKNTISLLSFLFLFFVLINLNLESLVKIVDQKSEIMGTKISLPEAAMLPKNIAEIPVPWATAKSILVIDSSGVVLYQKNSDQKMYPASTTKIMTSLVAQEIYPLDKILTVNKKYTEGQKIGLLEGEQLSFEALLKAMLIASANDAAETLADNYPGGRDAFIRRMNEKAKELYLVNTYFVNPSGIDDLNQYTSASDLAKITKFALKNETFAKIVSTKNDSIKVLNLQKNYTFQNVNELLGKLEGIKGVKTGYTYAAGECLVSAIERNNHLIYIVVLGSSDRFGETTKLANWTYANFAWF